MDKNSSKNSQNISEFGMPEKLPPQSIEMEQCLLGALMLDKDAIIKVADFLRVQDFYKGTHQKIYEIMLGLFEKGEPIDILSVSQKLKEKEQIEEIGGASYLTELINSVPTASHVLNYAKIVQQKRILRDLISASYEIGIMGYNEAKDIDLILDEAEKKIFSIAQHSLSQNFSPLKTSLEEAFKRIDELSRHKGTLRGLPTGFRKMDNILAGLQKSDLIILASRTSFGKSTLALDIARHIATSQKIPVGIFSLEMSKDQIVDRLIAAQANIDLWRLRTGRLHSDEGEDNDFVKVQHALGVLSELPIFFDDSSSSNILQMRAMARRLQAQEGLGLIIVDYLQLMESRTQSPNMVQQMTEVSRSLKSLARELDVPVLALSQLSRSVEQRHPPIPRLSDLRESGCLTGDTLITRADTGERIPIKDLVGQINIPVHSLDKDWKIKEMKISKVFSNGKKMVYELKTRSGFRIKASANHPFWKISGWTRLDELKIGDCIATPKKLELSNPKNKLSTDEIILLAHLLGNGCMLPYQPYHYTSADKENINIVAKTAQKLFNIKPRIIQQKNWWYVYLLSPYRVARGKSHPITNWYKKLGIKRVPSWNKKIPEAIFQCDQEKIALFLKHLWSTDSNLSIKHLKGRKPSGNIYYSTTSPKMAEGVKHLLLRIGIRGKITEAKKPNSGISYHIIIQGKENQLSFLTKVNSYEKQGEITSELIENLKNIKTNPNVDVWPRGIWQLIINPIRQEKGISWREFSAGIKTAYCGSTLFNSNISAKKLTQIADFLQSPIMFNIANSDIFWDEIISITRLQVEEVYDATVPGIHNFIANGIIVENSLEQDSDVVIFIHRPDKYQENVEKNVAEIIIAKHRNGPVGMVRLYFDEQRVTFRELEEKRQP